MNNDEACALESTTMGLAIINAWRRATVDAGTYEAGRYDLGILLGASLASSDNPQLAEELSLLTSVAFKWWFE